MLYNAELLKIFWISILPHTSYTIYYLALEEHTDLDTEKIYKSGKLISEEGKGSLLKNPGKKKVGSRV